MTPWLDMSTAPKGELQEVTRKVGKNLVTTMVHVAPVIIVASGSCDTVTLSRWLPGEERWNMFTKASPPMAWQPFPTHPRASRQAQEAA